MIKLKQRIGRRSALGLLVLPFVAQRVTAQTPPAPSIGFSLDVQASGLLNPTIKKATVKDVVAGSPAERAGIGRGDEVLAIDGTPLSGAEASKVRPLLAFKAGTTRLLRLRRTDGSVYEVPLGL